MKTNRVIPRNIMAALLAAIVPAIVIATITIAALSTCAPVGYMAEDTIYDTVWVEPRRIFYNVGESFIRVLDLSVYASYRNLTEEIALSRVTLNIAVDPDTLDGDIYAINEDDFILTSDLIGKGRKQIIVTLTNGPGRLSTDYIIMVEDPFNLIPGEEEEDGGGIGIIWKEPKDPDDNNDDDE